MRGDRSNHELPRRHGKDSYAAGPPEVEGYVAEPGRLEPKHCNCRTCQTGSSPLPGLGPARVWPREPDVDILLLGVTDQLFQTLLASDPRLLVAAKGGSRKMAPDLIHPNVARLHRGDGT